jgi:TRAP-type C4-dicarboxylate transport system permease small subunit
MDKKQITIRIDIARKVIHRVEDVMLVTLLLMMSGMAVMQIILRNIFESGILWGDTFVRILVLWVGLVGAMAASRKNEHISVDIIKQYLPKRWKDSVSSIVMFFTALVCLVTAGYSLKFVLSEFEYSGVAFAHVPLWICMVIIPFAFMVIAVRYFLQSISHFIRSMRPLP